MGASFPAKTPEPQLAAEQPLTGECWNPPKGDALNQGQSRSCSKTVGGAQSHLQSNLIPTSDACRVQRKACEHRDRGEGAGPSRATEPGLPLSVCLQVSCRGVGQPWPASGTVLQAWHVAQVLLEEAAVSPTVEPPALRLNVRKMKTMASGAIASWQIDGETSETLTDLTFLGSKITADGDCSHEIKRRLLLGRKAMTNLGSVLRSQDITLLMKVPLVKAKIFPIVMYGCENQTIEKAECRRIDAFCGAGEDS